MAFVLDASIAMSWAFGDEEDEAALVASRKLQTEPACVPPVWWYEIRNILLVNERRRRIAESDTDTFLRLISGLNIDIDRSPNDSMLITLGRRHRLTVYDAAYLELALRAGLPLATLDQKLAVAAKNEGVHLIG